MAAGRPTKYKSAMQDMADEYLSTFQELGQVVPTVAGLCQFLNVARSTVYKWAKEKPLFSDTLSRINEHQEVKLINGALSNELNSNIAKLMLANHGYSDKVQQDNISSDGSMATRNSLDDFYDGNA